MEKVTTEDAEAFCRIINNLLFALDNTNNPEFNEDIKKIKSDAEYALNKSVEFGWWKEIKL